MAEPGQHSLLHNEASLTDNNSESSTDDNNKANHSCHQQEWRPSTQWPPLIAPSTTASYLEQRRRRWKNQICSETDLKKRKRIDLKKRERTGKFACVFLVLQVTVGEERKKGGRHSRSTCPLVFLTVARGASTVPTVQGVPQHCSCRFQKALDFFWVYFVVFWIVFDLFWIFVILEHGCMCKV
jgi:hypothetical protein